MVLENGSMMSWIDVFLNDFNWEAVSVSKSWTLFFCGVFHKKDRATHTKVLDVLSTFLEMNIFSFPSSLYFRLCIVDDVHFWLRNLVTHPLQKHKSSAACMLDQLKSVSALARSACKYYMTEKKWKYSEIAFLNDEVCSSNMMNSTTY